VFFLLTDGGDGVLLGSSGSSAAPVELLPVVMTMVVAVAVAVVVVGDR